MKVSRHVTQLAGLGILLLAASLTVFAQEQEQADMIAAVTAATEPVVIQHFDSPAGDYSAQVTVYPCVDIGEGQEASYERLDLTDNTSGEATLIAEQVINCGGLGGYGLWVQRWTLSGDFLYYTDAREGQPDGMVTAWVPPVYRLRLDDRQVQRLGQVYFSPDGQQFVSVDSGLVSILPVDSDESRNFDLLPDLVFTNLVWLPDNSGLIYVQADQPFAASRSVVVHIDLVTGIQAIVLDTGA